MSTIVYHGTATHRVGALLDGISAAWPGLFVTEDEAHAQRYADAQASGIVSESVRCACGSAVLELATDDTVRWSRRPESHGSLDTCEAVIQTWRVSRVTVYARSRDIDTSRVKVAGRYVPTFPYLRGRLGDRLTIIEVT